jgi:hypothetical protein
MKQKSGSSMNVQIDISTKPESGDGKNPKLKLHFYPLAHHKLRPNSLILAQALFSSIQPKTTYHPGDFHGKSRWSTIVAARDRTPGG